MENKGITAIRIEISNHKDYFNLIQIYNQHGFTEDPFCCLLFGVYFFKYNDKERALSSLRRGAYMGVTNSSTFMSTTTIDATGQCLFNLITRFKLSNDDEVIIELTELCYYYLSSCINSMGLSAFDSYNSRAELFHGHRSWALGYKIISKNTDIKHTCEPLIIHDYIKSSLKPNSPHINNESIAINLFKEYMFESNHENISSIDDLLFDGEITHKILFEALEEKYIYEPIDNLKEKITSINFEI